MSSVLSNMLCLYSSWHFRCNPPSNQCLQVSFQIRTHSPRAMVSSSGSYNVHVIFLTANLCGLFYKNTIELMFFSLNLIFTSTSFYPTRRSCTEVGIILTLSLICFTYDVSEGLASWGRRKSWNFPGPTWSHICIHSLTNRASAVNYDSESES